MDKHMLAVKNMQNGNYTDEDRKSLLAEESSRYFGGGFDLTGIGEDLVAHGTDAQKKAFHEATNYFDGIRPFYVSKRKNEERDMPLIYDIRRGQIKACIGYVNSGANDFNSANTQSGWCPAAMIACNFPKEFPTYLRDGFKGTPRLSDSELRGMRNEINDLLYVYKKLKENSAGLNTEMIKACDKKHPQYHIAEKMQLMDKILSVPEAERFLAEDNAQTKKRPNLLKRLLGVGNEKDSQNKVKKEKSSFLGRFLNKRKSVSKVSAKTSIDR